MSKEKKLRSILISLSSHQTTVEKLDMDPIVFPQHYPAIIDREIVALIAASFAFGKVSAILNALEKVLAPLGPSPAAFLQSVEPGELNRLYPDFRYRFVSREGLIAFLTGIRHILRVVGNPGELVQKDNPLFTAEVLYREILTGCGNKPALVASNLLANPAAGGPAKRWMLFLRWMVRDSAPDLGLWQNRISPSRLIVPLDTHLLRISRYLGFTVKKTPSMRVAREITSHLTAFDPDDPLRFDFAIAHLGIDGICPKNRQLRRCSNCPLQEFCLEGRMAGNIKSKDGLGSQ
ncbi:MAG: TIGR02757 family protein [Acidobacteria bacterium]|nr:MAG: TIGR02757 family protein [Acidobacteriota bacterium]